MEIICEDTSMVLQLALGGHEGHRTLQPLPLQDSLQWNQQPRHFF